MQKVQEAEGLEAQTGFRGKRGTWPVLAVCGAAEAKGAQSGNLGSIH